MDSSIYITQGTLTIILLEGSIMEPAAEPSTDSAAPRRKPVTKNYELGAFINITLAVIAYFIGDALATYYLEFDLAGTAIGMLSAALSLVYFGVGGLREIPIAHRAIPLTFGTRQEDYELDEGWVWNWPSPIRGLEIVDVRERTLSLPLNEILTEDNVPISMELSIQYKVFDLFRFLNTDDLPNALQKAIDSIVRIIIQDLEADKVAQEKKNIPDHILKGFETEGQYIEGVMGYGREHWGIEVIRIRITQIRLPEELETANTRIQIQKSRILEEEQQSINEKVEAKHVAELIDIYKKAGLGSEFAANMAQTERSKATRIIIDGSGSALEKAGALAGGVLNPHVSSSSTTEPSGDTPGFKGSRRRKEGK